MMYLAASPLRTIGEAGSCDASMTAGVQRSIVAPCAAQFMIVDPITAGFLKWATAIASANGNFSTPQPEFPPNQTLPPMSEKQANNPLHGLTLEMILNRLVARYGWAELGQIIDIRCFNLDPSIASSLKFLRRTPWAREKVEALYVSTEFDLP